MADFYIAFKETIKKEGGYVNDPKDSGGETFMGIARKIHLEWDGWIIVDASKKHIKSDAGLSGMLLANECLIELVENLYVKKYWNRIKGFNIEDNLQIIANYLFESAVHIGVRNAIRCLQRALNILNYDTKKYPELKEDGIIGRKTLGILNAYFISNKRELEYLILAFRGFLVKFYLNLVRKRTKDERFIRGWLKRADWQMDSGSSGLS